MILKKKLLIPLRIIPMKKLILIKESKEVKHRIKINKIKRC